MSLRHTSEELQSNTQIIQFWSILLWHLLYLFAFNSYGAEAEATCCLMNSMRSRRPRCADQCMGEKPCSNLSSHPFGRNTMLNTKLVKQCAPKTKYFRAQIGSANVWALDSGGRPSSAICINTSQSKESTWSICLYLYTITSMYSHISKYACDDISPRSEAWMSSSGRLDKADDGLMISISSLQAANLT